MSDSGYELKMWEGAHSFSKLSRFVSKTTGRPVSTDLLPAGSQTVISSALPTSVESQSFKKILGGSPRTINLVKVSQSITS